MGNRGLPAQIRNGRQLRRNWLEKYASADGPTLEANKPPVRVAGRLVAVRLHGKAGFAHISGSGQRLQIYIKLDILGPKAFELFQLMDLGDLIGVSGHLFPDQDRRTYSVGYRADAFDEGAAAIA